MLNKSAFLIFRIPLCSHNGVIEKSTLVLRSLFTIDGSTSLRAELQSFITCGVLAGALRIFLKVLC